MEKPIDENLMATDLEKLMDRHDLGIAILVVKKGGKLMIRGTASNPSNTAMTAVAIEIITDALVAAKEQVNAVGLVRTFGDAYGSNYRGCPRSRKMTRSTTGPTWRQEP